MTYPLKHYALPLLLAALGVLAAFSLAWGDMRLSPAELWAGLSGRDELISTIIWKMRLPRLLVAALAGSALAASGLAMQAYFRNSLASPGLLGVSSGSAAGAVVAIGAGGAAYSLWLVPTAATFGAFVATFAVIALAKRGAGRERLLLAGIALNALLGAVVSYVLSSTTLSFERNAQILFWLMGGLEDRTWEHVLMASPILLCALFLWPLGRPLDLLCLGEKEASSLGVDVVGLRRKVLGLTTVMTALATAVTGSIGFVGLMVPHLLRLAVGPEHRRLVPLSLVSGASFVVACDLVGRFSGGIRVGIVTSLIGGPFFIWLLRRQT